MFYLNVLKNIGVKLVVFVLSFLSTVITARYVGATGRGEIVAVLTYLYLIFNFGNLGTNTLVTFIVAKKKYSYEQIKGVIFVVSFLLGIVSALIFYLLVKKELSAFAFFQNDGFVSFFLLTVPVFFAFNFLLALEVGSGNNTAFFYLTLLLPAWNFVSYFISFVVLNIDVGIVIIVNILPYWLIAIYYFVKKPKIQFSKVFFEDRNNFLYAGKSYATTLFSNYVTRVDVMVMSLIFNPSVIGIYSISLIFRDVVYTIVDAVAILLFPKLVGEAASSHYLTARVTRIVAFFLFPLQLGVVILSYFLIIFIYGNEFQDAFLYLLYLTPGIFFLCLQTIAGRKNASDSFPIFVSVLWGIAFLGSYVANYVFGQKFGPTAIPIIMSMTYFFVFVGMYWQFMTKYKISFSQCFILNRQDVNLMKEVIVSSLNKVKST